VTEALLALVILLLLGVLAMLAAIWKRRGDGGEAETQLRAEKATLEGQLGELRGRINSLEADVDDRDRRLEVEHTVRVTAETRLAAERQSFEEQRALLDEAEAKLKDAFTALSHEALKDSRTQFLSQADEKLKPIQKLLADYELNLREIEKARNDAYGGLKNNLDSLAKAHDLLQREAHQLSTALRSPTVRGRWAR
jgi:DNA recombination protein RmuC